VSQSLTNASSAAPQAWWRDPAVRLRTVDGAAAAVAVSLPWSTSATGILMAVWLMALLPTLDWRGLRAVLRMPPAFTPLLLVGFAVIGTLWAGSAWPARLAGINPTVKLLAIPLFLYHFQRSARAHWVFIGFLASCTALLAASYLVAVVPFTAVSRANPGVPVKNYIDQSQEFTLCLFALALPLLQFIQARRWGAAALCAALMLAFLANMLFVVSARTALVTMPVLLGLFAVLHLSRRAMLLVLLGAVALAAVAWSASPYLRARVANVAIEYQGYQYNAVTSTGQRLEYWRKSIKFIAAAPLFGNGTGSTRELFERDAAGQTGLLAEVIGNPHNQTLNVAVQWGLIGTVLLYAMWLCHLLLFRRGGTDLVAWIGLLVVLQNMVTSLLNSHLFDFHEGWMYVLGVGVAGGVVLRQRAAAPARRDATDPRGDVLP
jgi:O-antigen ligase